MRLLRPLRFALGFGSWRSSQRHKASLKGIRLDKNYLKTNEQATECHKKKPLLYNNVIIIYVNYVNKVVAKLNTLKGES